MSNNEGGAAQACFVQFLNTGHHVGVMWLVVQNYEATPWPVGHRLYCVIGGKLN